MAENKVKTVEIPAEVMTAENVSFDDTNLNLGVNETQSAIDAVGAIAKGRNRAHVFSTTAAMQEFLSTESNKGLYNVGDNLYIVDVDVPDWWVSEVLDTIDPETGYYYKIAKLETQKVDLTEIEAELSKLNSDKVTNSFTANRVLVSDANGKATVSSITSTILGYLSGLKSNVQTQLNNRHWKAITLPNPTVSSDSKTRTYSISLSNVEEILINLQITNYGYLGEERLLIGDGVHRYIKDSNSYEWMYSLGCNANSITIVTISSTDFPIIINSLYVKYK